MLPVLCVLCFFYEAIQLDIWTPALNHRSRFETRLITFCFFLPSPSLRPLFLSFSLRVLITATWLSWASIGDGREEEDAEIIGLQLLPKKKTARPGGEKRKNRE